MPFDKTYNFAQNNLVVIQHRGDKFLRVDPNDEDQANPDGGKGKFAQWEAEKHDGILKLKSKHTGKYLRMKNDESIDVAGGGGKWTEFKVHGEKGEFKLESVHNPGKYLAVGKNNGIRAGTGGKWCDMKLFRFTGGDNAGPFEKHYMFKGNNVVVIRHKLDKFLRVDPNDEGQACPNGGKGKFAHFEAEKHDDILKLKSVHTGKYLRMLNDERIDTSGGGGKWTEFKVHGEGGHFKLESVHNPGKYLAVGKNNNIRSGTGGPWCDMVIFRKN